MTNERYLLSCALFLCQLNYASQNCFQQSNNLNYLFLNNMSQLKIPLLPNDCIDCQSAYQVDIQLIDEQFLLHRTIQRIKIFLKNFEIEDSSYICLNSICPIIVEYGSDSILLNITSTLFSHALLHFKYLNQYSLICSIETRFSIFLFNQSFLCSQELYLHPRLNISLDAQFTFHDCRANSFEKNIYKKFILFNYQNFQPYNNIIKIKSTDNACQFTLDNTIYLDYISLAKLNELLISLSLYPSTQIWMKNVQTIGPCRTKIIHYRDMFYSDDIVHYRNINIKRGENLRINCPIDGSKLFIKYIWYYERYQPKYQISTNRTISFHNITEQMQGKYICIANDDNEQLEFEMIINVLNPNITKSKLFPLILPFIISVVLILILLVITLIICVLYKKSSNKIQNSLTKQRSLTIHHDVTLTIQSTCQYNTNDSLSNQNLYKTSSNPLTQIPFRFSIGHRNLNRQLSDNRRSMIKSTSDTTLTSLVKFYKSFPQITQHYDNIDIIKINLPKLDRHSLMKSSLSTLSFDSQNELDDFKQMTILSK